MTDEARAPEQTVEPPSMRVAEERVAAVNAVEPRMPLRSKAARDYARYLKVWFIGENDDFDEEAWQVQVSELAAIECEAAAVAAPPLDVERLALLLQAMRLHGIPYDEQARRILSQPSPDEPTLPSPWSVPDEDDLIERGESAWISPDEPTR